MTETYQQMKNRHEKEYNDFSKNSIFFAFSNQQFDEGMQKLGLDPNDTKKIYSIGNGGFILRTKSKEMHELFARFCKEHNCAIANDTDGTGYIYQMFEYEMFNHEYGYTGDISSTLDALDITIDEINADNRLLNGFKLAKKNVLDWFNKHC